MDLQRAVLDFCRGRDDAVVFGAHAVNFHTTSNRATRDVDILSPCPWKLGIELEVHLKARWAPHARLRALRGTDWCQIDPMPRASPGIHIADIRRGSDRQASELASDGVYYVPISTLVAMKVSAAIDRAGGKKGRTHLRDLSRLLTEYPKILYDSEATAEIDANIFTNQVHTHWKRLAELTDFTEDVVADCLWNRVY